MLSVLAYSHWVTAFFAYSAISLIVLFILSVGMICIISSQRSSLFLVTLFILIDAIFASIASYLFSNMHETALPNNEQFFYSYGFASLGTLALYVLLRIPYTSSEKIKQNLWENQSHFMQIYFLLQLLFPSILSIFLLIHFIIGIVWLTQRLVIFFGSIISFLSQAIIWPIKYVIIQQNSTLLSSRFKNHQ